MSKQNRFVLAAGFLLLLLSCAASRYIDGVYEARNKAVVLASGGFAANVEMRMKYKPALTADIGITNHPGAAGDGIAMA